MVFVDYWLGDSYNRCEHRPSVNQKGNLRLHGIGSYENDYIDFKSGKIIEPSVRNELARISNAIGSQKIAQAIRTSRTTGQDIKRVRIDKDGDAQITAEGEKKIRPAKFSTFCCFHAPKLRVMIKIVTPCVTLRQWFPTKFVLSQMWPTRGPRAKTGQQRLFGWPNIPCH
jgi:hypothetical protein